MSFEPTVALAGENAEHYARLTAEIDKYDRLLIAFSGGADSALLAYCATAVLGAPRALCVTAVSASLAPEDRRDTEALALEWGLRYDAVSTGELDNPDYRANDLDRCFYCKAELMSVLVPVAAREGATIALGVNIDDLGEHRPGQAAARAEGGVFPLVDAGLSKDAVRSLSRALGLRTWDKPANACLSSRVPQGTPVTVGLLGQVARSESALRQLGFGQLRVRHYGDTARIELETDDLVSAVEHREEIVAALTACGYRYVTLDLAGFSSGNVVRSAIADAPGAPPKQS